MGKSQLSRSFPKFGFRIVPKMVGKPSRHAGLLSWVIPDYKSDAEAISKIVTQPEFSISGLDLKVQHVWVRRGKMIISVSDMSEQSISGMLKLANIINSALG